MAAAENKTPALTCSRSTASARPSAKMSPISLLLPAALLTLGALSSCNDYPVHSLLDSFEVRVTSQLSQTDPIKLDFLWVIDHSPSMCQQQVELAKGFNDFITALQTLGQIDAQMAVVTVQQVADVGSQGNIKRIGQFNRRAETVFPPNCIERVRMPCVSDDQCYSKSGFDYKFAAGQTQPGQSPDKVGSCSSLCPQLPDAKGPYQKHYENTLATAAPDAMSKKDWKCKASSVTYVSNDNCSVNSYCWKHCTSGPSEAQKAAGDKECRDLYEKGVPADKQRIKCFVPGGSTYEAAGCQFPPATNDCPINPATGKPDDLPAVLTQKNLDLFHCIATVGASSTQEAGFEGGLRSAWHALDPSGPNCPNGLGSPDCQTSQLLRDNAYLVIVIVSDDDDCSVNLNLSLANQTPDEKALLAKTLPKEDWDKCQKLGDSVAGNETLNEGNCEYIRAKQVGSTMTCASDCHKLDPTGLTAEFKTCMAKARDTYLAVNIKMQNAKFAPTSDFVNRFKSLKADPSRVIVAAITGDSTAPTPVQRRCDAVNYYRSALKNQAQGQTPYVCAGKRGESGFGSRYIELVNAFKENGILQNICAGADFGPALQGIADRILQRTVKVCLPHPPNFDPAGSPMITVVRKRVNPDDPTKKVQKVLTYTADSADPSESSYFVKASPDCRKIEKDKNGNAIAIVGESQSCIRTQQCSPGLTCLKGLCRVYSEAIYFTSTPQPGDEVEVNYGADIGL